MADRADVVVVGAGAAGLATGIFAARTRRAGRVIVLDGARLPGAKILVSGGSRCNVTNTAVTEADFNGGKASIVRNVLRALPVPETIAFFRDLGVPLHEEPGGKLFPDGNRSRDVLDALLRGLGGAGAELRPSCRVGAIAAASGGFTVETTQGPIEARRVVLATGGLSLPKTGSDGAGYGFARALGHTIVPTTPALVPLLTADATDTAPLSGVAHPAAIDVWIDGARSRSVTGALLWTHFGISGPAALDVSRHWLRAVLERRTVGVTVSLLPGFTFEALDAWLAARAAEHGRSSIEKMIAGLLPASVAACVARKAEIGGDTAAAQLSRADRRALVHRLLSWPLEVRDSRGYNYAEVTAGGVALTEIAPSTMESRRCRGLHLVGEILDVDGRIGGFNFQWAWASARAAARALTAE